jgi:hypothetical protein
MHCWLASLALFSSILAMAVEKRLGGEGAE